LAPDRKLGTIQLEMPRNFTFFSRLGNSFCFSRH